MKTYQMMVFSNPVKGQEEAYTDWYNNVHIDEIVEKVPGFISAQRFAIDLNNSKGQIPEQTYLAVYEVETNDPDGCLEKLNDLVVAGALVNSDSLCRETLARAFYTPISKRREA